MAALDRDGIAAAALAIVDERGLSGFTMRAVAEALGVSAMALYHYVEDKAALAGLVIDAAIRAQPFPAPTGSWQDDLFAMASWMRQNAHAHPALGELRKAYDIWTPAILPMTERWLSLWQQSGLEPDRAVIAAQTSSMAIVGVVDAEFRFRRMRLPDDALFTSLPNAQLVFSAAHDFDRGFELLVRALISGLHARLSAETEAAGRHRRPRTLRRTS